ncbi:MAG: hypothetical protein CEE43_11240 [Promethearchaeota archaeon Loki_b32]|nr:MAG: hypothetical protein CEE43_11240 [Candidatus Lokiarchaeota archaeon Loki_b32]
MSKLTSYLESNGYVKTALLVSEIIPNPWFKRLKDISYLATFRFAFDNSVEFTRYQHSIKTAYYLSRLMIENHIEEEIGIKVILQGLLHDIGHIFFSHIGERILRKSENFNHEEYGDIIINENFYSVFKIHNIHLPLIKEIPNQYKILLNSHIDLDTLQGITKTAKLLKIKKIDLEKLIMNMHYSENTKIWHINNTFYKEILNFWKLKRIIYQNYVYSIKNQFIEYLMMKYISRIKNLSKILIESKIINSLKNNINFMNELNKLNSLKDEDVTKINLKKTEKFNTDMNILENLGIDISNKNYIISKVKIFKNPGLIKIPRSLTDLNDFLGVHYHKEKRLYIFT